MLLPICFETGKTFAVMQGDRFLAARRQRAEAEALAATGGEVREVDFIRDVAHAHEMLLWESCVYPYYRILWRLCIRGEQAREVWLESYEQSIFSLVAAAMREWGLDPRHTAFTLTGQWYEDLDGRGPLRYRSTPLLGEILALTNEQNQWLGGVLAFCCAEDGVQREEDLPAADRRRQREFTEATERATYIDRLLEMLDGGNYDTLSSYGYAQRRELWRSLRDCDRESPRFQLIVARLFCIFWGSLPLLTDALQLLRTPLPAEFAFVFADRDRAFARLAGRPVAEPADTWLHRYITQSRRRLLVTRRGVERLVSERPQDPRGEMTVREVEVLPDTLYLHRIRQDTQLRCPKEGTAWRVRLQMPNGTACERLCLGEIDRALLLVLEEAAQQGASVREVQFSLQHVGRDIRDDDTVLHGFPFVADLLARMNARNRRVVLELAALCLYNRIDSRERMAESDCEPNVFHAKHLVADAWTLSRADIEARAIYERLHTGLALASSDGERAYFAFELTVLNAADWSYAVRMYDMVLSREIERYYVEFD